MVKIAIWCRHENDNIIGIGPHIPWHVSSDFKRFKRITLNKTLLVGQTTYESFPNRTLPNRKIYVLTFDKNYQVSDSAHHKVINLEDVKHITDELYIAGGASIYKLMMEQLEPDFVVDSVYKKPLVSNLTGTPVDITPAITILKQHYEKMTRDFSLDDIDTAIWVKKGVRPDAKTFVHLQNAIYSDKG